jgi:hypothetical protein
VSDQEIAQTILQQLGGNRFKAMTGASSFASGRFGDRPGLSFRLPRCKDGIQSVIITLTPDDLYDITYGKIVKFDYRVVAESKGVFVETLRKDFESHTGLYTSL